MIRRTARLAGRATAKLRQPRSLWGIGGASLALALGVALLPWLFPAGVFRPISRIVASPIAIVLFGVVAGLLGAQALRQTATDAAVEKNRRERGRAQDRRGRSASDRWTPARPPEKAYYDEYRTTGEEIDSVFELDPGESADLPARRRKARKRIREVAIAVVSADENVSEETAARRISDGTWTDDPRAAALLGGRHLAPLRTRIRDWASGERFERWATHALDAIEARERGEPPEREEIRERGEVDVDSSDTYNFNSKSNPEVSQR
ncbi:DUF7269 family protein [Halorussus lipolyticus]|uniref:DUF7269 family protein n=1 Tax=Halorussus lipolyticus TaxID=3034024 RepID=UPI0023E8CEBC|nr:hypothetical protein [Halorussus sp. DT80]